MAGDKALIELRFQLDNALKDIKRLEKSFKSTTRDMDRDADKVDFDKTKKSLKSLDKQVAKTGKGFANFKNILVGIGAIQGLRILMSQFTDFLRLAGRQEQALKGVEQALKSTGRSAEITAEQMLEMAGGLQAVTTFGDEAILEMQQVLLTFDKLGTETLPRVSELVLDLSVRMGTDMKSAALQLGKALQAPTEQLSGLSRAGVIFTASQKETIKALIEGGKEAEAQAFIIAELETKIGGAARAMRNTMPGAVNAFRNSLDDLKEDIGKTGSDGVRGVVTALDDEVNKLRKTFEKESEGGGFFDTVGFQVSQLVRVVGFAARGMALYGNSFKFVQGAAISASAALAGFLSWTLDLIPGMDNLANAAAEAAVKLGITGERIKGIAAKDIRAGIKQLEQDLIDIGQAILDAEKGAKELGETLADEVVPAEEEAAEGAKELAEAQEDATETAEDLAEAQSLVADELDRVTEAEEALAKARDTSNQAGSEKERIDKRIQEIQDKSVISFDDENELNQLFKERADVVQDIARSSNDLAEAEAILNNERNTQQPKDKSRLEQIREEIDLHFKLQDAMRLTIGLVQELNAELAKSKQRYEELTVAAAKFGVAALKAFDDALDACEKLKECQKEL